jgi:hypothetical protein
MRLVFPKSGLLDAEIGEAGIMDVKLLLVGLRFPVPNEDDSFLLAHFGGKGCAGASWRRDHRDEASSAYQRSVKRKTSVVCFALAYPGDALQCLCHVRLSFSLFVSVCC